jgi:WD40 repeat protein
MALSPDGHLIGTVFADTLTVYNAVSGDVVFEKQIPGAGFSALAFSLDGNKLAVGGSDHIVRILNGRDGSVLQEINTEEANVRAVAFDPTGYALAVAGLDGVITIFDAGNLGNKIHWNANLGQITSLSYIPDGSYLGVGTADAKDAKIFNPATGKEVLTLKGHTDTPLSIAYSPDGTRLITSGRDFTAKIWDAVSGEEKLTLRGHTSTVTSARFSPDGKLVATSSLDGTIRLWDARAGIEKLTLDINGGAFNVEFTPDGEKLITWDWEGIKIFALNLDDLLQIAQTRLTRTWTPDECLRYLHTETCPPLP